MIIYNFISFNEIEYYKKLNSALKHQIRNPLNNSVVKNSQESDFSPKRYPDVYSRLNL